MNSSDTIIKQNLIPKNWIYVPLNEISKKIHYGYTASSSKQQIGPKFLRITDIQNNHVNWDSVPYCKIGTNELNKYLLKSGDLLFARTGATVGKSYLLEEGIPKTIFASYLIRIILSNLINKKYVYAFFQSSFYWNQIHQKKIGIGQPNVNGNTLSKITIPLPPLNEQKCIVSKLEELFTKLDAGIEYLKKNQILLKQYCQSILKNAFEGNLTEKWREEHKNDLELSSSILEKIFTYQNYKLEIEQIERRSKIYGVHEFPKEWTWIRIKDIAEKIQYGSSEKAIGNSNGIPVLRMGNIYEGKINYDNLKYYPSDWSILNEFLLQDGDILFNRTNSAELVGKTAVYHSSYPKSVFASYLIRIKILKNYYSPKILSYFINSIYGRKYIKSVVSQQVGQANVNGTKLSLMPIPLMSLLEQFKIIEEIDKKISKIENTSKIIEKNMKYSLRLKNNILKSAFGGKLVPQDPNDESAEMILERIKRERESTIPIKKEKSKIVKRKSTDNDSKQMRLI